MLDLLGNLLNDRGALGDLSLARRRARGAESIRTERAQFQPKKPFHVCSRRSNRAIVSDKVVLDPREHRGVNGPLPGLENWRKRQESAWT